MNKDNIIVIGGQSELSNEIDKVTLGDVRDIEMRILALYCAQDDADKAFNNFTTSSKIMDKSNELYHKIVDMVYELVAEAPEGDILSVPVMGHIAYCLGGSVYTSMQQVMHDIAIEEMLGDAE